MYHHSCAYCHRLKRLDQLMQTQSEKLICVDCADRTNMCMNCGSTTEENFTANGQAHYLEDCLE